MHNDDFQVFLSYLDYDEGKPLGRYKLRFYGSDRDWRAARNDIKAHGGRWQADMWNGRGGWSVSADFLLTRWSNFAFEDEKVQARYVWIVIDIRRAQAARERKRAEQRTRCEQRQTPLPLPSLAAAYDTLGLPCGASKATVQRAYWQLAMRYHPDHGGDHEAMAAINRAYETITHHLKEQAT